MSANQQGCRHWVFRIRVEESLEPLRSGAHRALPGRAPLDLVRVDVRLVKAFLFDSRSARDNRAAGNSFNVESGVASRLSAGRDSEVP